ncbi:hypothetical protein E4U52_002586 [Claviceps spartinae]|nr:hypothetical protein E4U52_002586 [Claviceps spartinae]
MAFYAPSVQLLDDLYQLQKLGALLLTRRFALGETPFSLLLMMRWMLRFRPLIGRRGVESVAREAKWANKLLKGALAFLALGNSCAVKRGTNVELHLAADLGQLTEGLADEGQRAAILGADGIEATTTWYASGVSPALAEDEVVVKVSDHVAEDTVARPLTSRFKYAIESMGWCGRRL